MVRFQSLSSRMSGRRKMITPEVAQEWFLKTTELRRFKKHREFVKQIEEQTKFLETDMLPQRLWHIIHQTEDNPKCKTCREGDVNWDHRHRQYKTYCSRRCWMTCPDVQKKVEHIWQDPEMVEQRRKKRQQTNLERYGHTNYLASREGQSVVNEYYKDKPRGYAKPELLAASRKALHEKYGVPNFSHTLLDPGVREKLDDYDWMYSEIVIERKTLTQVADELNITSGCTIVSRAAHEHGIELPNRPGMSYAEQQITDFLNSINIPHLKNDRTIIKPFELDFVIPEYRLAIEHCGLYWHSEEMGKDSGYHKYKLEECREQGHRLLTIFQDEWTHKRDVVKQEIKKALGMRNIKLKDCELTSITSAASATFHTNHGLNLTIPEGESVGLLTNGQLVAVATFTPSIAGYVIEYTSTHCIEFGLQYLVECFKHDHLTANVFFEADLRWEPWDIVPGFEAVEFIEPMPSYTQDTETRVAHLSELSKYEDFEQTLTEAENFEKCGIFTMWDCGKISFEFVGV